MMSIPQTPDHNLRSITQLSKPFLSANEIKYCFAIQGILDNDSNRLLYVSNKLEVLNLIQKLITTLKFPSNILQLTFYYYQRFYMFNEFAVYKYSKFEIAITALYISSKLQDYIKKLRDIVKVVNELKISGLVISEPKILQIEKKFLQTINFDFRFQSAEDILMRITSSLDLNEEIRYTSWLIINDSYMTELHIRFPCNVVAILCIQIAGSLSGFPQIVDPSKYRTFRVFKDAFVVESMEEILQFYMDYYNISFLSKKYDMRVKHEVMDSLINLKIDVLKQVQSLKPPKKKPIYNFENDPFFKTDRNFNQDDNVRFVYQKLNYIDEL